MPRPDALYIPAGRKVGSRMGDRVGSICDIAEPLLGVDRSAGQHAWIRQLRDGWLFVTADLNDTIYFARDDPRAGRPRYAWVDQPDGTRFGYLVEGARLDLSMT